MHVYGCVIGVCVYSIIRLCGLYQVSLASLTVFSRTIRGGAKWWAIIRLDKPTYNGSLGKTGQRGLHREVAGERA